MAQTMTAARAVLRLGRIELVRKTREEKGRRRAVLRPTLQRVG